MTNCQYLREGDGFRCRVCNRYTNVNLAGICRGPNRAEPDSKPDRTGLGDQVEALLKSIGVTPESYVDVKRRFGLPPGCNCQARREWLNRVGEWFTGAATENRPE